MAMTMVFALSSPATARSFIRDAEIEATLRRIAKPVLQAANLPPSSIRIILINDPDMNAFVLGRGNIFIHSGMLTRLKSIEMIQAVIAHEAAHLVSGHQISRRIAADAAGRTAGLGILLAAIAAGTGNSKAALPLALSTQEATRRRQLAHSRAQEASADQASVRYLAKAGIDPRAAIETLNLFRGQEILATRRIDPYVQTHPLNSKRRAFLKQAVERVRYTPKPASKSLVYWHARMVAKLNGFIRNPKTQLKRIGRADSSEISTYIRAIAAHRMSDKSGKEQIARLLKLRPNDPYYRELSAQFNFENGQIDAAISDYRKAMSLAPKEPLIASGLARALLAKNTKASNAAALKLLKNAAAKDRADPGILQNLALAYGRTGQTGRASLAIAERYALIGRIQDAAIHARRATGLLPKGSPSWKKAQDITRLAQKLQ